MQVSRHKPDLLEGGESGTAREEPTRFVHLESRVFGRTEVQRQGVQRNSSHDWAACHNPTNIPRHNECRSGWRTPSKLTQRNHLPVLSEPGKCSAHDGSLNQRSHCSSLLWALCCQSQRVYQGFSQICPTYERRRCLSLQKNSRHSSFHYPGNHQTVVQRIVLHSQPRMHAPQLETIKYTSRNSRFRGISVYSQDQRLHSLSSSDCAANSIHPWRP